MPCANSAVRWLAVMVAFVAMAGLATLSRADGRSIEAAPRGAGPFSVACSDVALDVARLVELGGTPSDFWEGNPDDGQSRYFTDVLLEPQDTIRIHPVAPNDNGLYKQTGNAPVPFVVIVCYPTSASNARPDYALPDMLVVPKMQRSGQKPIFPSLANSSASTSEGVPERMPLIVVSHGLAASPLDAHALAVITRLASHGYVVAAPFHGDARFSQIHVGNLADVFSVLINFDRFVEMEALRALALTATVDAVLAHPDFGPRIDPDKIGGFGASMGGAAMTWLLGASVTDGFRSQNAHPTVRDPRIKAVVGYVPFAGEHFLPAFGEGNATAAEVNTPYLAICGTADTVAPMDRMQQAMNLFRNSRYLVALTGVAHGYEDSYAPDVFGWSIPFLDAYVKGDAGAMAEFLQQRRVAGGLDDNLIIDFTAPPAAQAATSIPTLSGWGLILLSSLLALLVLGQGRRRSESGRPMI